MAVLSTSNQWKVEGDMVCGSVYWCDEEECIYVSRSSYCYHNFINYQCITSITGMCSVEEEDCLTPTYGLLSSKWESMFYFDFLSLYRQEYAGPPNLLRILQHVQSHGYCHIWGSGWQTLLPTCLYLRGWGWGNWNSFVWAGVLVWGCAVPC